MNTMFSECMKNEMPKDIEECIKQITHLSDREIQILGRNALEYAQHHLSMKHMVSQALSNLS